MIDNYDSFTFNLVQALGKLGAEVIVSRNDALDISGALALGPDRIVISPGPKKPIDAGISNELIRKAGINIPILGVCLGMQCINEAFGGRTIRARVCVHGKTSPIFHNQVGLYSGISNPFKAARYHSLITDSIPPCLKVEAWTDEGIPMGLRHEEYPIVGVQFHPESFMTEYGELLLGHFLEGCF